MKRKSFRFVANGAAVVATVLAVAALINYYHFSWTGYLSGAAGLCEHKTVMIPVKNGFPQKLSFDFDLASIAREMRKNPNYRVSDYFERRGAVVSRNFAGVNYQISFQNSSGSYEGFNLNTSADAEKFSFPSVSGENCTAPDYRLKENVRTMIDDLPLSDAQKAEAKQYVGVVSAFGGKFW